MGTQKFTTNLFLENPPILAHYIESSRNLWVEGNPRRARLSLLGRPGRFIDLEAVAVERRHLVQILGVERARMLLFRMGFESGRREARRHLEMHDQNQRLAIQAGLVYGQVQARFVAKTRVFEMDLSANTLLRELVLESSSEAAVHRMSLIDAGGPSCWRTAGYLSGHLSEIVGRRVLSLEEECAACGQKSCRLIAKFDAEWGPEVDWQRAALSMDNLDEEIERREKLLETAQSAARTAQLRISNLERQVNPEALKRNVIPDACHGEFAKRIGLLAGVDSPVLLCGERGVGKETMARSIHHAGPRKDRPFIGLDGSGLPGALGAQELFGYAAGAGPGGAREYEGALARARGGTLYLTDVDLLSLDAQAALLQALNEGSIRPAGSEEAVPIDVRLMASTAEHPAECLEAGRLHAGLFDALRPGLVEIEALRDRSNDITRLAQAFLHEFRDRHNRPELAMSSEFKRILVKSTWPGNVSQLRSVIEHAVLMSFGNELEPGDLPDEILVNRAKQRSHELSKEVVGAALKRTRGNRTKAAELLGVGRTTLWRAMKRHAFM